MKKVLAICLKTYPDESDMQDYCDGNIEPCNVKIYYKGKKYKVGIGFNSEYFKLVNENEPT